MTHEIEETGSESSYTRVSSNPESVDDVKSVDGSDSEDAQATTSQNLQGTGHDTPDKEEETKAENEAWKKDDMFFLSLVTFRVEDQLFRVPKDAFESQSEQFRKLFANVPGGLDGNIDEPIFLDGVEKDAFRNLLRLMYPPPTMSPFAGAILLNREQWIKLLDLAQTWGFAGFRDLAIKQLELAKFEEVEKLEFALKYHIKQWYADAYFALAKRPGPLSVEEGQRLGLELSLKITRIRERRMTRAMEKMSQSGFNAFGGSWAPFGVSPSSSAFGSKAKDPQGPHGDTGGNASAGTPDSMKRTSFAHNLAPEFGKSTKPTANPWDPAAQVHMVNMASLIGTALSPSGPEKPMHKAEPMKGKESAASLRLYYDDNMLRQDIKETFCL